MKTSELILKMQQDLQPVRPQATTGRLAIGFLAVASLSLVAWLSYFGPRGDWLSGGWIYFVREGLSLALLTVGALLLGPLSRPGLGWRPMWRMAVAIGMVFLGLDFFLPTQLSALDTQDGLAFWGEKCSRLTLLYALVPAVTSFVVLHRRLVLDAFRVSLVSVMVAAAGGRIGIELYCDYPNHAHVWMWHLVVPLTALLVTLIPLGLWLFRPKVTRL
ncbi:MAG: NrsF family protein [Bdellovibrionales bacterium]